MKKNIVMALALALALPIWAGAVENEGQLNDEGKTLYSDCIFVADKFSDFLNKDYGDFYKKDCYNYVKSDSEVIQVKKKIISTIAKRDFNIRDVISENEYDFSNKLGLIASFLIESPDEKIASINYIEGDSKNHSVEEQQEMFDKLDIMFKKYVINSTLYRNLDVSRRVLLQDWERIKEQKNEEENVLLALNQKYKEDIENSESFKDVTNEMLSDFRSDRDDFVKSVDFYLGNFDKYMKSRETANLVYRVFNTKNPLFVNPQKLPKYSKAECQVLIDWKLKDLFEEKHPEQKGKLCKK